MRRILLLALVLLAPGASAAVTVDDVEVPERTLAEKAFPVRVTLENDGPARTVHLFGALYAPREAGDSPCGPATDTRFRTFTHLVQENVELPARSTITYPASGEWLHRYQRQHVAAAPAEAEFCVFVANATTGPVIQYETYATTALSVRGANARPAPSFSWSPREPGATEDVRFEARATDADGDPVAFRWDFGHANAEGRAVAEGAAPTAFFYPAGEYVVTLYASDGLEEAQTAQTITVRAEPAPEERPRFPVPGAPVLLALLASVLFARRR